MPPRGPLALLLPAGGEIFWHLPAVNLGTMPNRLYMVSAAAREEAAGKQQYGNAE
jgi:hypothetical protein